MNDMDQDDTNRTEDALMAGILEEALLDTKSAAQLLGVSPRTIQAWVSEQRIPHVKLGVGRRSLTRFRPAALRAWIESQEIKAKE
jgi:excisionase family DNA binding protein